MCWTTEAWMPSGPGALQCSIAPMITSGNIDLTWLLNLRQLFHAPALPDPLDSQLTMGVHQNYLLHCIVIEHVLMTQNYFSVAYVRRRTSMPSELIELSGHIIDSWTLPRSWDIIMDRGGNFNVEEMRVGKSKTEPSYARLRVEAPNDEVLDLIISELQQFGAVLLHGEDAQTV